MEHRIKQLMDQENLTASKFAETIGAQRSSISHILSGRNKPSLELINKILDRYPDLNTDWLLLGKGDMYGAPTAKEQGEEHPNYAFEKESKGGSETEPRKVPVKIVILYSDQSFEEYYPQNH